MNRVYLIFQLRWMLFKNSLRTRSNWFEVGTAIFVGTLAFIFDMGMAIGLGFLTYYSYDREWFVPVLTFILAGITLMWVFAPLFTLNLGEQLDAGRLRTYPFTANELFGIDLLLGLFDPFGLSAIPLMGGVVVGLTLRQPSNFVIAAGFLLILFLFNLALSRYVQRLIGAFFATRRRKELLGILFVILAFAPQILLNINRGNRISRRNTPASQRTEPDNVTAMMDRVTRTSRYLAWTPPGIAARAICSGPDRSDRSPAGLLLLFIAGAGFTTAIVGLEYTRVDREFTGRESLLKRLRAAPRSGRLSPTAPARPARHSAPPVAANQTGSWIESLGRLVPGASPQSLAVFEKDLRYLYRSPRAMLMIGAPILACVIFVLPGAAMGAVGRASQYKLSVLVYYCLFAASSQVFNNSFSFDSHGAKLYFMLPVQGKEVLKGKNMAGAAAIFFQVALVMILYRTLSGVLPLLAVVNAVLTMAIALPALLMIGNYLSVLYPKAMDFGKVAGRTYSGVAALMSFAAAGALALIIGAASLAGWLTGSLALQYGLLGLEFAIAAIAYGRSLDSAGRLLQTKAEPFMKSLLTVK